MADQKSTLPTISKEARRYLLRVLLSNTVARSDNPLRDIRDLILELPIYGEPSALPFAKGDQVYYWSRHQNGRRVWKQHGTIQYIGADGRARVLVVGRARGDVRDPLRAVKVERLRRSEPRP